MNIEEFESWIEKNNIIKRTKESYLSCMENYINEEPNEFMELYKTLNINLLVTKQSTINLCINYEFDEPIKYVSSTLEIKFEGEELGYYDCIFGLDGSDMDDYLRLP